MSDAQVPMRMNDLTPRQFSFLDKLRGGAKGFVLGLALLLYAFYLRPPAVAVLTSVRGPLTDLSFHAQPGRRFMAFAHFKVGGHPEEFCNHALADDSTRNLLRRPGVTVEVYYDPHGHRSCSGGAIETYGLTVDGIAIQTPDRSLGAEKVTAYFVLPVLSLLAFWIGLRQSATPGQREHE
jgi:hypothetical protein